MVEFAESIGGDVMGANTERLTELTLAIVKWNAHRMSVALCADVRM